MDDINPLRIIEEECASDNQQNADNNFSKDEKSKRISLMIVEEERDFVSIMNDDHNNNTNHLHRLSLQIDGSSVGDESSLVLKNDAMNSTIIKIGSCKGDLEDDDDNMDDDNLSPPPLMESANNQSIVNLLGQINDIVGLKISFARECVYDFSW
jgi:hypothetical protein